MVMVTSVETVMVERAAQGAVGWREGAGVVAGVSGDESVVARGVKPAPALEAAGGVESAPESVVAGGEASVVAGGVESAPESEGAGGVESGPALVVAEPVGYSTTVRCLVEVRVVKVVRSAVVKVLAEPL